MNKHKRNMLNSIYDSDLGSEAVRVKEDNMKERKRFRIVKHKGKSKVRGFLMTLLTLGGNFKGITFLEIY